MKRKSLILSAVVTLGLVSLVVGPEAYAANGAGTGTAENNIRNGVIGEGFEAVGNAPAEAGALGEFDILAGKLTLDKVPSFHFQKAGGTDPNVYDLAQGAELVLVNATVNPGRAFADEALDGSDSLDLVVSDYRGEEQAGWKVYANMTPFKMDATHVLKGTKLEVKPKIKLARTLPEDGIDVDAPKLIEIPATEATAIVVQALAKKGTLTNTFDFDSETLLSFTKQAVAKGNYQSKITWSLANVPPTDGQG